MARRNFVGWFHTTPGPPLHLHLPDRSDQLCDRTEPTRPDPIRSSPMANFFFCPEILRDGYHPQGPAALQLRDPTNPGRPSPGPLFRRPNERVLRAFSGHQTASVAHSHLRTVVLPPKKPPE